MLTLVTLLYWATGLTWGFGGRSPHVLSYAAVLLILALAAVRPWNVLPRLAIGLSVGLGLAAFGVVATAPTGWEGAPDAASYAFAGLLYLLVAGWARDGSRIAIVLTLVPAAGGMQFAKGWLAWWGSGTSMTLFQGTFYWHNQVGIFLAAGAVAGFAVAAHSLRPAAAIGWVLAPLAAAGVVFSTSRGSQIALALGVLGLVGVALASADRWCVLPRLLALSGLSVGVSVLLSGPPFFAERLSAVAGTAARSKSLSGNGVQRLEDWRRAGEIFQEWPLSGAGFHSFDSATSLVTDRRDGAVTAFAHNGFLQAAADGGLLLAMPLWGAVLLLFAVGVRRLPAALRAAKHAQVAAVVVLTVLLLHSGMDFDWDYPSLLAMAAIVAAVATGPLTPGRRLSPRGSQVCLVVTAALLALSAVAAWGGGLDLNAVVRAS